MLPVGTPSNGIAYDASKVKMKEMIKAGAILYVIGALITVVLAHFL